MKKVLVIDDSAVVQQVVKDDLEAAGYLVVTADSSEDAMDVIFSKDMPDVIILDVMMPGMEGDTFCRLLKNRDSTKHIPIILVSTKEDGELQALVEEVGADGYMRKARLTAARLEKIISEHAG